MFIVIIYYEFNVSLYIFRIPFLFSVFKLLKSLILCLSLRARTPGAESFLSTRSLYIPLEFFFLFKDLKLSFDRGWFCCLILLKSNEYRFHILCMPYKVNYILNNGKQNFVHLYLVGLLYSLGILDGG